MTASESDRRPFSNRALLLLATVILLYALGLYLWISTAVGRLTAGEHALCGDAARTLRTEIITTGNHNLVTGYGIDLDQATDTIHYI